MKITIRRARKADMDALAAMERKLLDHEGRVGRKDKNLRMYLKKRDNFEKRWIAFVNARVRKGMGLLLVAEVDGDIAGFSYNTAWPRGELFGVPVGVITSIYVNPKYRGHGISSRLKDEAFGWFKGKRIKYASIFLIPANTGPLKIYRRWGFKTYALNLRRKI